MLTQTTEYALQALAFLAAAPRDWHEVGHVAENLGIPTNYLSKVLGQLSKLGILESRKGWGGGFRIKDDPGDIPLEEVVRPLEGVNHPRSCALGLSVCSDENPCPLHDYWKRIVAIHEEMLRETTVADLVTNSNLKDKVKNHKQRKTKTSNRPRGKGRQKAKR